MKKLLVFSGSFDPFHNGHYMMLKFALTQLNFDKVIISISKQNPFKEVKPISYEHRLKLVQLGLYELSDQVIFDEFENNQDTPSYTCNLIEHLANLYPDYEINYLLGSDSYFNVHKWKNIHDYFHKINWIVFKRDNNVIEPKQNVIVLNNNIINISSTDIKKFVRIIDMAPKALEYMNDYGLYGEQRVLEYTPIKRFEHVLRVAEMTQAIMKQYEPEHSHWGWTAGIYHDIAKAWNLNFQGNIGTNILKMEFETPKILHGYIGAYMMKTQYLFTNQTIINAVARHTKPYDYCKLEDLTNLDMALYCADKLEPTRTEEDCHNIEYYRNLLKINLKQCFVELYDAIQNQFHKKD